MLVRVLRFGLALGLVSSAVAWAPPARAQNAHDHTPAVSGVPQGVPLFCAAPTATSVTSGPWSSAKTWSGGHVPGPFDKVRINAGHDVTQPKPFDTGYSIGLQ